MDKQALPIQVVLPPLPGYVTWNAFAVEMQQWNCILTNSYQTSGLLLLRFIYPCLSPKLDNYNNYQHFSDTVVIMIHVITYSIIDWHVSQLIDHH